MNLPFDEFTLRWIYRDEFTHDEFTHDEFTHDEFTMRWIYLAMNLLQLSFFMAITIHIIASGKISYENMQLNLISFVY